MPDISIQLNGRVLTKWEGLQVVRSIDSAADAFSFSAPWKDTPENRITFAPYSPGVINIRYGQTVILTGYAEIIEGGLGADGNQINVQGRSTTGVLVDWSAGPPFEFIGMTFNQIATEVARPNRVEAVPDTPLIDIAEIEIGQTVYNFLSRIASAHNLWARPRPSGALVFSRLDGSRASVAYLEQGRSPVVAINTKHDSTQRFNRYITILSTWGPEQIGEAVDPGVAPNIRGRKIIQIQQVPDEILNAANFARARGLLDSYSVTATVAGWEIDGIIWEAGMNVDVLASDAFIYRRTKYTIRKATLQLDESGGRITALDLCLPETFEGRLPRTYPWQQ